ncbi:tyrosine-type recombinase/integrase [Roseicyclus amphidinii]|uniref:tyrosine-type recombinase/integrase n=1 Tax=Roseicyclus amphidinii TaxID=3034232 RepID=UPI0024E16175|nr:tyrosine-type recombinase/integrase [Roseicyclus sp. Amp-Y-6]
MTKARPPIPGDLPTGLRQRQRADGTWRVWWEPSATRRTVGMTPVELDPDRPTAAVRAAEDLNRKADRLLGRARPTVKGVVDQPRSLEEVANAWLASPRVRGLSDSSLRNYTYDARRICDHWAGTQARLLTRPAIVLWYDALYDDHGPRMAQRLVRTLGTMLKWAARRGYIATNPATDLDMETPARRARVVSWPEFDALCDAADALELPWLRRAMELAMYQGQRPKDIRELRFAALSMERIDEDPRADPRLTWTLVRSKDRKRRVTRLAINAAVVGWLMPLWQQAEAKEALVIADAKGRAITTERLSHAFHAARTVAAETCPSVADARFSDLRRSFSTVAYRNGVDPSNVDDALGNTAGEDPGLRQVYMPASDIAAMRAVDAVTRPNRKE